MKTYKDCTGKEWGVSVTVGTIKRVKDLIGVNLLDAVSTDLIDKMRSDPVLLCDILYAVCKPQADADGVSDEAFGESLAGDAITSATEALLDEIVDFFPSSQRTTLRKALTKIEAAEKQIQAQMEAQVDAMMDEEIAKRVKDFTENFGALQENSE